MTLRFLTSGLLAAMLVATPLHAVTLLPGTALDPADLFDAQVADGDPAFFGALLASGGASVTEIRDGFDGFEVIPGLYNPRTL